MGTLNSFYVGAATDNASVVAAIRTKFPSAEILAGTPFCGAILSPDAFEAPEEVLMELSSQLKADVVWLSFQSVVDAFQFHHWRSGRHLRSLVYGSFAEERTWERADGIPEPWERDVFFGPKQLKFALDCVDSEDDRLEVERIWRDADIQVGRFEAALNARECARKVAKHFHLPGWE